MRSLLYSIAALVLCSCRFDGELQGGNKTLCQDNSDCPSGAKCVGFGVCVQADSVFLSKRIEPSVVGPRQTVRITLEYERARAAAPGVWAFTQGIQSPAVLTGQTERRYEYEWQMPARLDAREVIFVADSALANQRVVELGSVAVDSTPPVVRLVSQQLTPPSTELLGARVRNISKVTHSTGVEVVVQSDEPLAQAPRLWFVKASGRESLRLVRTGQASEWRYEGNVGTLTGTDLLPLVAEATDNQGNSANESLTEFVVDTEAPAPPPVDEPNAVVFHRAPEGTLDAPDAGDYRLSARPAAFAPHSLVIISSGGGIFARLETGGDGSIANARADIQSDLDTVVLRVADEAGNISQPVEVRDIEFTAYREARQSFFYTYAGPTQEVAQLGLGFIEPGLGRASPALAFYREPVSSWPRRPEVLQSTFVYLDEDCASLRMNISNNFWSPTSVASGGGLCAPTPGARWPRWLPSIVRFDLVGSRRVDLDPDTTFVVGAFGSGRELSFRGVEQSYRPSSTQLPRRYAAATLDLQRDQVVLFGGENANGGVLGDTWVMPATGQLMAPAIVGPKPPARKHAAMAYHPGLGRVVLHGGNDGARTLSDTWLWNGTAWAPLPQSRPIAREQHEMIYGSGMALISGGLRDGAPSPATARLIGDEWSTDPIQRVDIPSRCSPTGPARASVDTAGLITICPAEDGTGYLVQPADGGTAAIRVADLPFLGRGPDFFYNFRIDATRRFGLAAAMSDSLSSSPPAALKVLSRGNWVVARNSNSRPFVGACFVWKGEFACNDGRTVMLSNDLVVQLPPANRPIVAAHIWPQSDVAWVAERTTDDNRPSRFVVHADGTIQQLGALVATAEVVYAGAPTGELFVMLRHADGIDQVFSETFDGEDWVIGNGSAISGVSALTQAIEGDSGRFFSFNAGHLFGAFDPMAGVSPLRTEVISRRIRPTLETELPSPPARCDDLRSIAVEAQGSGLAGGTPGFGVHLWNGLDFSPSPAIAASPGLVRAKASHSQPGAAARFGTTIGPILDAAQLKTQPMSVRFATEGATRGALDGELRIEAFQVRYACRRNRP